MNKYKVKLVVRPIVEADDEEQAMELAQRNLG
jgi:hypothetical protein